MLVHPKRTWYLPLCMIPEGKSGKMKIAHRTVSAGTPVDVVSVRTMITTGRKALQVVYPIETTWTYLIEGETCAWMSNTPQEQDAQYESLKQCKGRVLVGGFGLGLFIQKLQEKKNVEKVDVIEKSTDVYKLVWKHLHLDNRFTCFIKDLYDWLKEAAQKKVEYDWVYLDIWRGTSEAEFIDTVLPLKQLVCKTVCKNPRHILAWSEDVMLGQFEINITTNIQLNFTKIKTMPQEEFNNIYSKDDRWSKMYRPFWKAIRELDTSQEEASILAPSYIKWLRNGLINNSIWNKYLD